MTPMSLVRQLPRRLAFWALAGVGLLISHDAIWLAQTGPGQALAQALRHGAHDYWGAASVVLALGGLAASGWAATRLLRLERRSADGRGATAPLEARPYLRRAAGAWLRLFAVVAIGFVIQENVEHVLAHGHAIGAGALLGPEYPLAIPVVGAISLLAALVMAAFQTAERVLLARVHPRRPATRAPLRLQRPRRRIVLPSGLTARAHAGRAPPILLVPA